MKYELLNYIICPVCKSELSLKVEKEENGEILNGFLLCNNCYQKFPIVRGIPRMVLSFPDIKTAERFGYEWKVFNRLSNVYEKQFLDWIYPVDKEFFKNKIILDAGCGKGRHLYLSAIFGAKTVIGIDVSEAVEVAYSNTKNFSNVHVVQADIYNLPFKNKFDYIYSIGVLHHLPDPEKGFYSLVKLLKKPGGVISIWVYGREGNGWIIYFVNPIRRFLTSKMPLFLLKILSLPLTVLIYFTCKIIYRPLNLYFPFIKRFLFYNDYFFYISEFDFKEIHTIIFDHLVAPVAFYLKKGDVVKWFENSRINSFEIYWHNRNSWRAVGRID